MEKKLDSQIALKHLQEKWGTKPCQMCEKNNWSVSDTIFELRPYQGENIIIGSGPIVPIFPVTCNNCGNTILVNAIVSKSI